MRDRTEDLTPGQLRVLLAVCRLYSRGRPVTVAGVARLVGHKAPFWVHESLVTLRKAGLVDWAEGKAGTIVPRCRVEVLRRGAGAGSPRGSGTRGSP